MSEPRVVWGEWREPFHIEVLKPEPPKPDMRYLRMARRWYGFPLEVPVRFYWLLRFGCGEDYGTVEG